MPRVVDQPAYEDLLDVADAADVLATIVGKYLTAMYTREEFQKAAFRAGKELRGALRRAGYRAAGELPNTDLGTDARKRRG